MAPEINNYITKRYKHWIEYSKYHCDKNAMSGLEYEVLSEVMVSVLQRDEHYLLSLIRKEKIVKDQVLTEFDFVVLRAVKLNITSETAPFKHKTKPIPRANVEVSRLKILDLQEEETDHAGYVLDRMHQIRNIIDEMGFSEKAMAIFEYRFFEDGSVKDWPGVESSKEIYSIYGRIMKVLKKKINGELLI